MTRSANMLTRNVRTAAARMTTWHRTEPGWYTSERGEIYRERGDGRAPRGWYWFPTFGFVAGPFRTLALAERAAEKRRA